MAAATRTLSTAPNKRLTAGLFAAFLWLGLPLAVGDESLLSPRNLETPFPYLVGGARQWPILERPLPEGATVALAIREGDEAIDGEQLSQRSLSVTVASDGRLQVTAGKRAEAKLAVEITIAKPDGESERQTLEVRPAPPDRPISYYADFSSDLIRIFMDPSGRFRPVTKSGFDQYFRRLQAHGTRRLIVWLSPFPFIADASNYDAEDWRRYEKQARAILGDQALTESLQARTGFATWSWLRYMLAARLDPAFGRLLGQSAAEHGVSLTVSFRPFEAALTKYYEVPAFDEHGDYLWGFLPLASPTTHRAERVGWRHYREVLREVGQPEAAELAAIELPGVAHPERFAGRDDLRIVASPYPLQSDEAFVLVRDAAGEFAIRRFDSLRAAAEAKLQPLEGFTLRAEADGLHVGGVSSPRGCRYLILSWTGEDEGPDLSALAPVVLRAKAGNRLGRETTYWVEGAGDDPSRVAGITATGEYWAEFQASQASQSSVAAGPSRLTLAGRQLVIDLGAEASVEMIDFNQPPARENAVREMATVLALPGFDEILISTRSHVDLPTSTGDGDLGVRPIGKYWHERSGPRLHLGLDKAYLPRSPASLERVRSLAQLPDGVERITTWQPNEWSGECQTPDGPRWRYARNRGVADGLRLLLEDFERAFPGRRMRVLIPPSESAVAKIKDRLDVLPRPSGGVYGRNLYDQLWPSNNHIPAVGEGAAMVDLRGLSVAPALLGSGGSVPGEKPFELYVRECLADLKDRRGSSHRGPRSYFFEAQGTLRATDMVAAREAREAMICHLLSQRGEIDEVILYEAADWLYFLPLSDADLCGHAFLDRCSHRAAGNR